ncbi:hypothetical protein BMS3Bbin04_02074 [bacterium BMS3Bbin04]|nr:hypothetical protein BMS3Bbin04_02074 [bacterium BMS3Bbin04]
MEIVSKSLWLFFRLNRRNFGADGESPDERRQGILISPDKWRECSHSRQVWVNVNI